MIEGLKIVTHDWLTETPVLQVSPRFEWVSDKFRQEMDQWLLERFGKRQYAYVMPDRGIVFMHPSMVAKIIL